MTTSIDVPTIEHWIGGHPDGAGSRFGEVTDPATGAVVRRVPMAEQADVDRALDAACAGFSKWGSLSLGRRANVLFAFRELLRRDADALAESITAEHGKTLPDALGEVQRGLEVVEFACGLPHLLKGEASFEVARGVDTTSLRQPLGVVAGITPFNFPVMVPLWMAPMALAAGNAFVLKPSEKDPSPSLLMARLWAEAGLPEGAFTVLHGDRVAVDALLTDPRVAAVSFVGSTPIARHVYETATAAGKRVQALGGAKNHAVVLPDADPEAAADAIASAAFGSAGQRCMAISVAVLVGDDEQVETVAKAIEQRAREIKVGAGSDADTEMGPLVTVEHRDKVAAAIDGAEAAGARLRLDGRGLTVAGREDGAFLGPTIVDQVDEEMAIYREEVFGPVLTLLRSPSLSEAIELVNRNPYGNGAAIFTGDGRAARTFELGVEAGMVGVNVPIPVPIAYYSFGGWNASLFGDLHVHGREAISFYTRGKVVTSRWPEGSRGAAYHFPAGG